MIHPLGPTRYFFDALIPKNDPWAVVEFRKWLLQKCYDDPKIAEEVWIICSRDFLFYVSFAGWLLEPRDKAPWQPSRCFGGAREIPFCLRPYQITELLRMQAALGRKDMLVEKSREMGATWMALYLIDHVWRFRSHTHAGVMSRDEASADKPDDPDSLLSKMDFIDDHLPVFLKSERDRKADHTIVNRDNGSTIVAWACTANVGRSGRKYVVLCDEAHFFPPISDKASLDSLQHTTYCRILMSTPNKEKGQSGAFYDIAVDDNAVMERFEMHWKLDDAKRAGLYKANGNTIEYLDPGYVYPANYKFIRDGKERSPYYDYECSRPGATENSIASELDIDYGGATSKFFSPGTLAKAALLTRDPNGRVDVRQINGEWVPELFATEKDVAIDLWVSPESGITYSDAGVLRIPEGRSYSMGIDVAYGLGKTHASCSALSVIDTRMSIQVAEFASNRIPPEEFALFCAAVGSVFNSALMCIEVTGIGQQFLAKILQFGYRNLWYRPKSKDDPRQINSFRAGYDNKDGGLLLLGELQHAFQRDLFQPRSKRAIDECKRYYIDQNGNLKHPLVGRGRQDAPEKSHGDCAIAMGAAWFAIHSEPEYSEPEKAKEEVPYGSFAWRRNLRDQRSRLNPAWWDPFESQPVAVAEY